MREQEKKNEGGLDGGRGGVDLGRVRASALEGRARSIDLPEGAPMDSFTELVLDQMRGVPALTWRRMFGGCGFYSGGLFIAVVFDGRLYLKTDEPGRAAFLERGMGPFTYEGGALTSFWEVPADVLEDADELSAWAARAVASARAAKVDRVKKSTPGKPRRPKGRG